MTHPLANLEPAWLWRHFDQLRQIPRPSRKEQLVRQHVKTWAAERSFAVREDAVGNVCIAVPATAGHEKAPIVILQGHLDMVAEKDNATAFDFEKDPIAVTIDGDWVVAVHTTLGADNGVGVAAAMACADDPGVVHGPLELLLTVDEETGLTGASNLEPRIVEGRTLLNLDSEEDRSLFVGCAGGGTTTTTLPVTRGPAPAGLTSLRVAVTGLKGGHSGLAIHENRGNSIKILARVLHLWQQHGDALVCSIEGGNKRNAIPREASAVVLVPTSFAARARELAAGLRTRALTELAAIDPGLEITVTEAGDATDPIDAGGSRQLVGLLTAMHHGVIAMSRDIVGLTETSTNLAVIQSGASEVTITSSSRSLIDAALRFALDQVAATAALAGASCAESAVYPGWQPNLASPLLQTCKAVFRELNAVEPNVVAIHAGLECGIIGEKLGGADMISFGPLLEGVHAPGERVNIPSVARFWRFTKAVLQRLA